MQQIERFVSFQWIWCDLIKETSKMLVFFLVYSDLFKKGLELWVLNDYYKNFKHDHVGVYNIPDHWNKIMITHERYIFLRMATNCLFGFSYLKLT